MQVLNIFHVLIAISMIAFILIQKGAGATAGAAFGSGASGTVFGSRGAGNFLSRTTWVLAAGFCLISLTMAVLASRASTAPETDLGVVGTTSPATEEVTTQTVPDVPTAISAADSSDVPSVDAVIAQPAAEESTGDLPVIESGTEAVPVSDGSDEDSSGSDGS
ncbi:MAG: preprotein translocase subunit SecG [Gammaproteobacteria bacterium]|nr:preprotein translocase subunit SecG [Gammaproteobacteria bacterium]